jgi:hypothetical protein
MQKNNSISNIYSFNTQSSILDNSIFKPRLYRTREEIFNEYYASGFLDLNKVMSHYLDWVNLDEYVVIKKKIYGIGVYALSSKVIKLSKRGNDVYNYRVSKRFSLLYDALENYDIDQDNCYVLRSDILFFTLTYANRDIFNSYMNSGKDYNRFMSNLRKIFPRAKTITRCFESQSDGTLHIHALIYIGTHIDVTFWKNIYGVKVCIIKSYALWEKLKNCWKYGFSDIKAFVKLKDGLKYIFKYVGKSTYLYNSYNSLLTIALNWLFKKRSFSINYKMLRILFNLRLDTNKHNSNSKIILQCIGLIIEREFVGIFSKKQLGLDSKQWFYEFYEFPKELINVFWGRWDSSFL